MKLGIYSIYDSKANAFQQPFYFVNDEIATRAAQSTIEDQNSAIAKYPEDFTLISLGTFDPDTGEIEYDQHHRVVLHFKTLRPRQQTMDDGQLDFHAYNEKMAGELQPVEENSNG